MAGMFITFEGGEGSGKTTQIQLLAKWLEDQNSGISPLVTREPGGTSGAEDVRNLLVTGSADKWLPATEALLMSASRHEHVERTIKPALAAGQVVISDRYYDSTTVYQGIVGGVDRRAVQALHDLASGGLSPDITILLDMDVELGLGRAHGRGGDETRFETKGTAFHQQVRHGFLALAEAEPDRICVIDAAGDVDSIFAKIRDAVAARQEDLETMPANG